jgi:hypothetical protein
MFGLDQALGARCARRRRWWSTPAAAVDVDTDGISIAVADDTDVVSPPLPHAAHRHHRQAAAAVSDVSFVRL